MLKMIGTRNSRIQLVKRKRNQCRISIHDISSALVKRKVGKASEPSGVVAEVLKAEMEFGIEFEWLTDMCYDVTEHIFNTVSWLFQI